MATRVVVFLSLSFVLLYCFDLALTNRIPKNTVIKNYWLLNKKNERFDIAFIGPSRVLNTIDGGVFKDKLNIAPINLGLSGAGYAEQYLLLKLFLKENKNSVGTLFIETSYFNFIDPDSSFSYPFHEYYYFPYIKKNDVYDVIMDNTKQKLKVAVWRYLPFVRYAEFNSNFRPLVLFVSKKSEVNHSDGFDSFGTQLETKDNGISSFKEKTYSNSSMDPKTIGYLIKMIDLAKENRTEVVLFTAPVYRKTLKYSQEAWNSYSGVLQKIISQYKLKYYNFESISLCDSVVNFNDKTHLNKRGALRFSSVFSDSLKVEYSN